MGALRPGGASVREYEFIYIIQPDAMPEREQEIHGRGTSTLCFAPWGSRILKPA